MSLQSHTSLITHYNAVSHYETDLSIFREPQFRLLAEHRFQTPTQLNTIKIENVCETTDGSTEKLCNSLRYRTQTKFRTPLQRG